MTLLATEFSAANVANVLGSAMLVDIQGARDSRIGGVSTWAARLENSLSYQALDHERPPDTAVERTVICSPASCRFAAAAARIVVDDPRAAFMYFLRHLLYEDAIDLERTIAAQSEGIQPGDFEAHPSAIVESPVVLGRGVCLGANVVINKGSIIGSGTNIGAGAVIGQQGRAIHKCADGRVLSWRELHVGTVYIGSDSEIGAHTVINRAMLGQTRIGMKANIGNLVHIGHGAMIEDRVWIGSHTAVLGHVSIGSGATIGARSALRDNIDVGQNAAIGMGSVVVGNVAAGESVLGHPAKPASRRLQTGPER